MLVLTLGLRLRGKLSRMLRPKPHTKASTHPIGLKYHLPNLTKFDTNFLSEVVSTKFFSSIQHFIW
jgi:hypothetical protein